MKKKYTKETALRECYNLWRWLAKQPIHPGGAKEAKLAWPGWRRFWATYGHIHAKQEVPACPACIYSYLVGSSRLCCYSDCIIPVFAKADGCATSSVATPFKLWIQAYKRSDLEATHRYASAIANSAMSALRAIRKKEK